MVTLLCASYPGCYSKPFQTLLLLRLGGRQGTRITFNSFFSRITLTLWSHPRSTPFIPGPLSYAWFGVTIRDVLTSSFVYPESALNSWSALMWVSCDSRVLSLRKLLA